MRFFFSRTDTSWIAPDQNSGPARDGTYRFRLESETIEAVPQGLFAIEAARDTESFQIEPVERKLSKFETRDFFSHA